MDRASYERLSVQDRSFLVFEDARAHMHVGGLAIFGPGSLTIPGGGLDIARIRAHVAARLHLMPRYRQRLAWVPLSNRPIWVDDEHFDLTYHVRHTAVPHPGSEEQLKPLAGRLISQPLDTARPLWELWVIEGLQDSRFAMVIKAHHAVADGISAFGLFAALLGMEPTTTIDPAPRWTPRPAPSSWALLRDELALQLSAPLGLADGLVRLLWASRPRRHELGESIRAIWDLASTGLSPPPSTPLNRPIGPHRRFDWLSLPLDEIKAIKNRLGGTVNDVVLAIIAGALRGFLKRRHFPVRDLEVRVVVPVNLRVEGDDGAVCNRVSAWLIPVPVGEPDPRRRFVLAQRAVARARSVNQQLGAAVLAQVAEYAAPALTSMGVRLVARLHPYNLIVSNVPGPQMPLYLLDAPLLAGYPQMPLFENQGLGVALFSYCGALCWGFNADLAIVPDVRQFVAAVEESFAELRAVPSEIPRHARARTIKRPRAPGRRGQRTRRAG